MTSQPQDENSAPLPAVRADSPAESVASLFAPTGLANAVGLPMLAWDANGVCQRWNRAAEDLFGYPAAEIVGQSGVYACRDGNPCADRANHSRTFPRRRSRIQHKSKCDERRTAYLVRMAQFSHARRDGQSGCGRQHRARPDPTAPNRTGARTPADHCRRRKRAFRFRRNSAAGAAGIPFAGRL